MRARLAIGGLIGLILVAGVVVIISLRPTNEHADNTPSGPPTTTTTTPARPRPTPKPEPGESGRVVAGGLSVLAPKGMTGTPVVSRAVDQVILRDSDGKDLAAALWAPNPARSLGELTGPLTQRIPGDTSAPRIRSSALKVAGLPGELVRLDYPLFHRTRLVAIARRGGRALTIQVVVPTGQASKATKLLKTLARTTVVRNTHG